MIKQVNSTRLDGDRPTLPLKDAHRRAQGLLAEFDGGREVGYTELVDEIFALAFMSVTLATHGESSQRNSVIWERISDKSSSLKP